MKRIHLRLISALILTTFFITSCAPAAAPSGQTKKLTVACDATWPPFEIVNEQTKEVEGYGIDLMKALAQKAGLEIEFANVGFDTVLAGIAQCQYDMAVSSITITEERKKDILFSDPYFGGKRAERKKG